MNLLRYKKLTNYEIGKILDRYIGLTDYQKSKLYNTDWFPFSIVQYTQKEPVKPIWRLTVLFYWLYCLLIILLISPVMWLLYGRSCVVSEKDIIYRIYSTWTKKLGFY